MQINRRLTKSLASVQKTLLSHPSSFFMDITGSPARRRSKTQSVGSIN
jgi:hypothetical protein